MYLEELLLITLIVVGVYLYRNYKGENIGKFITESISSVYNKYAPYSFKVVREKAKELGQNKKAINALYNAEKYAKDNNERQIIYHNMAVIYQNLGDFSNSQKYAELSEQYK